MFLPPVIHSIFNNTERGATDNWLQNSGDADVFLIFTAVFSKWRYLTPPAPAPPPRPRRCTATHGETLLNSPPPQLDCFAFRPFIAQRLGP